MATLKKTASIVGVSILGVVLVIVGGAHLLQMGRSIVINDSIEPLISTGDVSQAVSVEGVPVIEQEVSCGYAVIEMLSSWSGGSVTEEVMMNEHDSIVTAMGTGLRDELDTKMPSHTVAMRTYLSNSDLLRVTHESLAKGNPVSIGWAAPFTTDDGSTSWTLHYSVVTGMDVGRNEITVANPYGYVEILTLDEFLARTRYDSFEPMPFWMQLAFDFGLFEKNTVFVLDTEKS